MVGELEGCWGSSGSLPPETHVSYGTMVVGRSWLGITRAPLKDALATKGGGPWLVTYRSSHSVTVTKYPRGTTLKKQ